jgi:ABC-2 type transport system permease protein
VPFRAPLRSEWTKLRSLRSTWWCTGIYLLVVGATGWLAAASTDMAADVDVAVDTALTGFGVGQLVLVVLGVVAVTSEFVSGTAMVSLTVVPRRTRLLLAKTIVVGAYCTLLTAVLAPLCALGAAVLTAVPGGIPVLDPGVLRSLGLQIAAAGLTGVLAVGLGTVLRSTAGAVGVGMSLVLVLPTALALAGGTWPSRSSQALPALRVGEDAFLAVSTTWPAGIAVVAAWAVGTWVLGAVLLERRDV